MEVAKLLLEASFAVLITGGIITSILFWVPLILYSYHWWFP